MIDSKSRTPDFLATETVTPLKRPGRIRLKITLVICFTGVFTAFLVVGIASWWVYDLMAKTIKERQFAITKTLAFSISRLIDQKIQELRIHTGRSIWEQSIVEVNAHYQGMSPEAILAEMQKKDKEWITSPPRGFFLRAYLENPISLRLKQLVDDDPDVAEIFLTDQYGGLVAASGKTTDFYQADEIWWQKAYAGGKGSVFIGDVERDQSSGILSIPVAVPIKNNQGEILGIAKESLGVELLFSSLKNYKIGKTGYAVLIDKAGNIIFHEGQKPLSAKLFDEKELQQIPIRKGGFSRNISVIHKKTVFAFLQPLENSFFSQNGITWYVCVTQDVGEAFSSLNFFIAGVATLLCLVLIISILLGWFAGDRFSEPIHRLSIATERIKAGEWDYKVGIRTGDEIEWFANTFFEMVQQIREKQRQLINANLKIEGFSKSLEQKVEERTQELTKIQDATMNILEDLVAAKADLETRKAQLEKEIAERQKVEEALRESKGRLDLALQAASMGVWQLNIAEKKRYFDGQVFNILGMDPREFTGSEEEFLRIVHPDDHEIIRKSLQQAIETGMLYEPEYRVMHPDGSIRYVAARGRLIRDEAGNPVKINGIVWDITELKRIQEELLRSNKELEQFAYVASHDLQEPLRKILAFSKLISDKDIQALDEESRDYLSRMQNAAFRMSSLIEALLAYSRVATREKVLEHVPLKAVVEDVLSDLELRIQESHAVIEAGPLPVVYADRLHMQQLFQNLIGNAIRYCKKDVPPHVIIRSQELPKSFKIVVEDNGIGFDIKYKDRIFAAFQRLHTREEYEGSGIGLTICQKIVRQLGGEITVQSELGKGSIFTVTLPKV